MQQQFRPSGFNVLPVVIKNLLIINGIFFLAQNTINHQFIEMEEVFALHTFQSPLFKPWQIITHLFMHGDLGHLFSNMLALYMFGSVLENTWGNKRFITFYFLCGMGAAAAHLAALYYENNILLMDFQHIVSQENLVSFINKNIKGLSFTGNVPYNINAASEIVQLKLNEATLGASGAVFGCLAAFGFLFPNQLIYLYFFVPLKAKWFVVLYAAFELFTAIQNSAGDNVAHVAHLGGALVGFLLVYYWNKKNRNTFY